MATRFNFAEYSVEAENGNVDLEATIKKFADELVAWNDMRVQAQEQVGSIVEAIFQENAGKVLAMPFVHSQVVTRLSTDSASYAFFIEAVKAYMKANTWDGKKGNPCSLYRTKKGFGGGVVREVDAHLFDKE